MATRQNLIDTYNSNPTLQSKYTLPQYLALFDFSQTTTPTQTTTTTPTQTPATPGIPNIINQNLNQGGGDGGTPPPTRPGLGYRGPGSTVSGNFNIDDIGEGTIDSDDLSFGLSVKEGLYGLQNLFSNLPTPFNLAKKGMESFNNFLQQQKEERAAKAQLAAQLAAAQREIAAKGYKDHGQGGASASEMAGYEAADGSYGGASTQDYGGGEKDGGLIGYNDGGRVYLYNRLK
jgi:hypothetical protein